MVDVQTTERARQWSTDGRPQPCALKRNRVLGRPNALYDVRLLEDDMREGVGGCVRSRKDSNR